MGDIFQFPVIWILLFSFFWYKQNNEANYHT